MLAIHDSDVGLLEELSEVGQQSHQLSVLVVVVKRNYRNAVLGLHRVADAGVVDDDHVFQVAIYVAQVLNVQALFQGAVLAIEPVTDALAFLVEMVDDSIGIEGVASCEDDNFGQLRKLLEELSAEGSDVDSGLRLMEEVL